MHGEFGLPSPGKASSHSTALPSCYFSCVQCFRVSVIRWTAGSLTCVRAWSFLHRQRSCQHISLGKLTNLSCTPDGVRTSGLWISSRCTTNWPTPHHPIICKNPKRIIIRDGLRLWHGLHWGITFHIIVVEETLCSIWGNFKGVKKAKFAVC